MSINLADTSAVLLFIYMPMVYDALKMPQINNKFVFYIFIVQNAKSIFFFSFFVLIFLYITLKNQFSN